MTIFSTQSRNRKLFPDVEAIRMKFVQNISGAPKPMFKNGHNNWIIRILIAKTEYYWHDVAIEWQISLEDNDDGTQWVANHP